MAGRRNGSRQRPDLTALGKMIGGGFPVGAVAGRKEVMEVFNPLVEKVLFPHSGTFSANPVTMTAGLAAMEYFDREQVARLNRLGGGGAPANWRGHPRRRHSGLRDGKRLDFPNSHRRPGRPRIIAKVTSRPRRRACSGPCSNMRLTTESS